MLEEIKLCREQVTWKGPTERVTFPYLFAIVYILSIQRVKLFENAALIGW